MSELLVVRVEAWARDVRSALAPVTLRGYLYLLGLFFRSPGIATLDDLTRENLRRHIAERREKDGITPQSGNKILAAVLSFASWLEENGEIPLDRLLELRRLRLKTKRGPAPRFLTREEYARLLAAARAHRTFLGLAVAMAVHTGLRMTELRHVHHEDLVLDVPDPFVRVLRDKSREIKTRVARTPAISMWFAVDLRAFGLGAPRTGPIFVAGGGQKSHRPSRSLYVGHKALENWMDHARNAAGLGDDVTFITLRHTYASWLIQGGVPIAKVASWLGHDVQVCWRHYCGFIPGGDKDVEKGFLPKTPPVAPKPPSRILTPPTGLYTSC